MRLEIITRMDRNEAIAGVRQVINQSEGWIVDHTLFSNLSATIRFEIPSKSKEKLAQLLSDAHLHATPSGDWPQAKGDEVGGIITITFIHRDPDLKRPVPAFG